MYGNLVLSFSKKHGTNAKKKGRVSVYYHGIRVVWFLYLMGY